MSLLGAVLLSPRSQGYYEDDPAKTKSSAHYDLTLALARCAGYTNPFSNAMANACEATDTGDYGTGGGGTEATFMFTSRTGPNKHYFHFPQEGNKIAEIKNWGNGPGSLTITIGGSLTTCTNCCDTAGNCVDGDSIKAFGIQLHSMGDYWSHKACVDAGGIDHSSNAPMTDQPVYCPLQMHDCEWGLLSGSACTSGSYSITAAQSAVLRANSLKGLQRIRDAVYARAAADGHTLFYQVTDADLAIFAGYLDSADRVNEAASLKSYCDCIAAHAC
jgi:hypothetical protein